MSRYRELIKLVGNLAEQLVLSLLLQSLLLLLLDLAFLLLLKLFNAYVDLVLGLLLNLQLDLGHEVLSVSLVHELSFWIVKFSALYVA